MSRNVQARNNANRNKPSPEDLKKQELMNKIAEIKCKIDQEESYFNVFDMERERFNEQWVIYKKELDTKRADIINQDREMIEFKERNQIMIQLYREKVKQMLYQKQDEHAEMRYDIESKLADIQKQNIVEENELITDNRGLKRNIKESEVGHKNYVFNLKMDTNKTSTLIRNEFEREKMDLKAKYDLMMQKLRQEMEDKSGKMINDLEADKEAKINEIINLHNQKYKKIKNYYSDITASNLLAIKQLKQELHEAQKIEEKDRKMLLKAEDTFKKLSEPLEQKTLEIKKLKADKEHWKKVKEEKTELRNKIADQEKEYRDIEYEYEIKFQQYQYLKEEYNRLKDNRDDKIYEIFQKAGLQNLILEKELKMLQQKAEVVAGQVQNIIVGSNLSEEAKKPVMEKLAATLNSKDDLIADFKDKLLEIREAHIQLIQAYQTLLRANNIPVDELGFEPYLPKLQVIE